MPKKTHEKSKTVLKLEKSVAEILVIHTPSLQPYLKTFHYQPENVAVQPLGSLLGIFEIEDRTQDSAYIVNFLASLVKKEYFSHPKRLPLENLEAALHKVNRGLGELAKQGNTEWLGTLNAAICVLEKHNVHFSVAGAGRVLLMRNQELNDISDGLCEEGELHPFKTFTDVSSGRLNTSDKLIVGTDTLFHAVSPEEIERNGRRLLPEKFSQFLKTALVNQLDIGGALIVDVWEEEISQPVIPKPAPKKISAEEAAMNAWSETAFQPKQEQLARKAGQTDGLNPQEEAKNYVDTKTGHIYVQGDTPGRELNETWQHIRWFLEERIQQFFIFLKSLGRYRKLLIQGVIGFFRLFFQGIARATSSTFQWIRERYAAYRQKQALKALGEEIETEPDGVAESEPISESEVIKPEPIVKLEAENTGEKISMSTETSPMPLARQTKLTRFYLSGKSSAITDDKEIFSPSSDASSLSPASFFERVHPLWEKTKIFFSFLLSILLKLWHLRASGSRSQIARLKNLCQRLSPKQRVITLTALALALLIILMLFIFLNRDKENIPPTPPEPISVEPVVLPPLHSDKNVHLLSPATLLITEPGLLAPVLVRGTLLAVTPDTIIDLTDTALPRKYPLPDGAGSILKIVPMRDLGLLFLLTDKEKLLSFSPGNHAFSENKISLPPVKDITALGTYLTYLYVLDSGTKTIYRYPRIEGGFGEKTTWLKDTLSPTPEDALAINENLYLSQLNQVSVFSRGKNTGIQFENSATPVVFNAIFADATTEFIYTLDALRERLIRYDKNGTLLDQYTLPEFKNARSFTLDEPTKKVYFSTTKGELFTLTLE